MRRSTAQPRSSPSGDPGRTSCRRRASDSSDSTGAAGACGEEGSGVDGIGEKTHGMSMLDEYHLQHNTKAL